MDGRWPYRQQAGSHICAAVTHMDVHQTLLGKHTDWWICEGLTAPWRAGSLPHCNAHSCGSQPAGDSIRSDALSRQGSSHIGMRAPVGASLLAMAV